MQRVKKSALNNKKKSRPVHDLELQLTQDIKITINNILKVKEKMVKGDEWKNHSNVF